MKWVVALDFVIWWTTLVPVALSKFELGLQWTAATRVLTNTVGLRKMVWARIYKRDSGGPPSSQSLCFHTEASAPGEKPYISYSSSSLFWVSVRQCQKRGISMCGPSYLALPFWPTCLQTGYVLLRCCHHGAHPLSLHSSGRSQGSSFSDLTLWPW